jgi:hypothetical protein
MAMASALAERYVEKFSQGTRPRHREVVRFVLEDADFRRAQKKYRREIQISEWIAEPQRMQPVEAAREWGLPAIETLGDLADWLCLSPDALEWLADLKALGNKSRNSLAGNIITTGCGRSGQAAFG